MKEKFKKFNEDIKLTSNQREDAKIKYKNLVFVFYYIYLQK